VHSLDRKNATKQNKSRFSIELIILRFYFWYSFLSIVTLVQQSPVPKVSMTLYCIHVTYIFIVWMFDIARKSGKFYIPALSELTDTTYQRAAILVLWVFNAFYRSMFLFSHPVLYLIDILVVVTLGVILLMHYQSHTWTTKEQENRDQRLDILRTKAGLSNQEVVVIRSLLISNARTRQQPPKTWLLFRWFITGVASPF